MRTTIRRLPPVKGGVAGGVDLLAKPVQFVMQTVRALHVMIVGEPGHRTSLLASRGNSAAMKTIISGQKNRRHPRRQRPIENSGRLSPLGGDDDSERGSDVLA